MAFLVLDRVAKRFGANEVLKEATLSVEHGESLALVGPSGSGKTLLLRLIAGMLEPDAGRITLDGRDLAGLPSSERGTGLAFQNFALYPHLSAFENIASPLRARGRSSAEIKRRVAEVAGLLRIDHVLEREPRRLSNGQKQRTALARSLVSGARLQMLDDPLRNVDAKLRYEMRFELPRLLKTFEATSLYVTQDFREAMAFGDRIAVLEGGRFVQVDRAPSVYSSPATLPVAKLFGDPTLNTFTVKPAADGSVTLFAQPVPIRADLTPYAGQNCTLGIRPEHVRVASEPGPGRVPMELEAVTPLSDRAALLLRAASGEEVLAVLSEDAVSRLPGHHGTVHVGVEPAHVLAFDPAGGLRAGRAA